MLTVPNANDPDIPTLVKVRIHDGSEWHAFGNYGDHERVFGVELSVDIDNPSWQCSRLEFRNNPQLGPSLDPDDPTSDFNDGTIADTILHPKHKMEVLLSKDYGSTWVQKFRGEVGKPSGRRKVDRDDVITISPKDASLPLKEPVIEGVDATKQQPYEFNDIYIEDLIDEIIQLKGHDISLDRTHSDIPNFLIRRDEIKGITPWKAAQNVANKVGHKLTFRNVGVGSGIKLILLDPDRGKLEGRLEKGDTEWTIDETFAGGWDIRETEKDQMDVRTGCRVHYVDRNLGQHSVFVEDAWALENYGARDYKGGRIPRNMVLVEEDKSHIDTETEAKNYAHYNLGDQNAPESTVDYGVRHAHPGLQLYDILEFTGSQDYDVQMVATDISISVGYEDRQRGDTQIHGTMERVRGSRKYWFEMGHLPDEIDAYRGDQKPPPTPEDPPGLEKTNYIDDTETERAKVYCEGAYIDAPDIVGYSWRYREVIDGDKEPWQQPNQTGEPATLINGLDVGKNIELEVQYKAEDFETSYPSGVDGTGEWSPIGRISLYPDTMPPKAPTWGTATGIQGGADLSWNNPTENKDGSELHDLAEIYVYWSVGSDFSSFNPEDDTTYDGKQKVGKVDNWTHQAGTQDTKIYYKLVAYDYAGNYSTATPSKSVTTKSAPIGDGKTPAAPDKPTTSDRVHLQEDGGEVAKLIISWAVPTYSDGSTVGDIMGYEIAVKTGSSYTDPNSDFTDWEKVASSRTTQETIIGVDSGLQYNVAVRAYDYEEKYSDWSTVSEQTISTDDTIPEWTTADSPANFAVNPAPEGIDISWDKPVQNTDGSSIDDLKGILVYYSTTTGINVDNESSYEDTKLVDGVHWLHHLEKGETYTYKATPVDESGNEGAATSEITATARTVVGDHDIPDDVDSISLSSGYPKVDHHEDGTAFVKAKVEWPDTGMPADLAGYILQITTDDTNWSGSANHFEEHTVGRNTTQYTFGPLDTGTTYYVRVKAEDTEDNVSSNWVSVTISATSDTTPPDDPGSFSIGTDTYVTEEGTTMAQFLPSWSAPSQVDVAGYRLYIQFAGETNYQLVKDVGKDTTSTVIEPLSPGQDYDVKLTAYDTSGNESSGTEITNKTAPGDMDTAPNDPTISTPVSTSTYQTKDGNVMARFTVEWSAPSDKDLDGFRVYTQFSSETGNYQERADLGKDATQAVIEPVSPDVNYDIKVTAYDKSGNESSGDTVLDVTSAGSNIVDNPPGDPTISTPISTSTYQTEEGNTVGRFTVSWSAPSDNDLDGFRIYTALSTESYKLRQDVGKDTTSVEIEPLSPGATYDVKVTAYDTSGNESSGDTVTGVTAASDPDAPSIPNNISLDPVAEGIDISWDNPSQADFRRTYVLIRNGSEPDKSNYDYIFRGDFENLRFDSDKTSDTFYVRLYSEDKAGNESALSPTGNSASPKPINSTIDIPAQSYIDQVIAGDLIIGITFSHASWTGFDRYRLGYQVDTGSGWNGTWSQLMEDRSPAYKHVTDPINGNNSLTASYAYKYRLEIIDYNGNVQDTTIVDNGGSGWTPNASDNSNIISNTVLADKLVATEEVRAPNLYISDLANIQNKLTVDENQIEIGEGVIEGTNDGIQVSDTTPSPRVKIGEVSSGNYGIKVEDGSGGTIFEASTAVTGDGEMYASYIKNLSADHIDVSGSLTVDTDVGGSGKIILEGSGNGLLKVLDGQSTPQTRVQIGDITGSGDYGIRVLDENGNTILRSSDNEAGDIDYSYISNVSIDNADINTCSVDKLTAGTLSVSSDLGSSGKIVLDGSNNGLIKVLDSQSTPQERVQIGDITGSGVYGIRVLDGNGNAILRSSDNETGDIDWTYISNVTINNADINDVSIDKLTTGNLGDNSLNTGSDNLVIDGSNPWLYVNDGTYNRVQLGDISGSGNYGIKILASDGSTVLRATDSSSTLITGSYIDEVTVNEITIASELSLNQGGILSGGASGWKGGGWWLGDYDGSGDWRFSIGDDSDSDNYLAYDTSNGLVVRGDLQVDKITTATVGIGKNLSTIAGEEIDGLKIETSSGYQHAYIGHYDPDNSGGHEGQLIQFFDGSSSENNVFKLVHAEGSSWSDEFYIQSPNFSSGSSGWKIQRDGSAEFNSISIRDDLTGNFSKGTNGWKLWDNGDAEFNAVTIRGTLDVPEITLSNGSWDEGHLSVSSLSAVNADMGTLTAGEISLTSGKIKIGGSVLDSGYDGIHIEDGSAVTRVEIGELSSGTYGMHVKDTQGDTIFDTSGVYQGAAIKSYEGDKDLGEYSNGQYTIDLTLSGNGGLNSTKYLVLMYVYDSGGNAGQCTVLPDAGSGSTYVGTPSDMEYMSAANGMNLDNGGGGFIISRTSPEAKIEFEVNNNSAGITLHLATAIPVA